MQRQFTEHFEENFEAWTDGTITDADFRVLILKWAVKARRWMVQNHSQLIEDKFKQCGMFNAIDGSENKKAKITGCGNVYDVDGKEEAGALEDYLKNNADKHSTTAGLGRATTYDLDNYGVVKAKMMEKGRWRMESWMNAKAKHV